jgi:hypothetical protein
MNWRRGLKRVAIVIFIIWELLVSSIWLKTIHNYFDRYDALGWYCLNIDSSEKIDSAKKIPPPPPGFILDRPFPEAVNQKEEGICWNPMNFLIWAVLTPLIIAIMFYAIGWIVRGFKESKQ